MALLDDMSVYRHSLRGSANRTYPTVSTFDKNDIKFNNTETRHPSAGCMGCGIALRVVASLTHPSYWSLVTWQNYWHWHSH